MSDTPFTPEGLGKIAEITIKARGRRTLAEFEILTAIPTSTIQRIENVRNQRIAFGTLQKLAPFVGYSAEELYLIGLGLEQNMQLRDFKVAEDLLIYAYQLSDLEKIRLAKLLLCAIEEKMNE